LSETGPAPFHVLLSYAYIRKTPMCDLDALAEAAYLLVDSGAFTIWHDSIKSAAKLKSPMAPITVKEYTDFVKQRGDAPYGCIALDRIYDPAGTADNLKQMLDAGVRPMPVMTIPQPVEEAVELCKINPRFCVAGAVDQSDEWIEAKFAAVQKAAPEAQTHGLGYTRFPGLVTCKAHSGDSSSATSGQRYGQMHVFDSLKLHAIPYRTVTPRLAQSVLPLKLLPNIAGHDAKDFAGGTSLLSVAGCVAFAKYSRLCWSRGKRLFLACSNSNDLANALLGWWMVNIDPTPRTLGQWKAFRPELMNGRVMSDLLLSALSAAKRTAGAGVTGQQ